MIGDRLEDHTRFGMTPDARASTFIVYFDVGRTGDQLVELCLRVDRGFHSRAHTTAGHQIHALRLR